MNYDVYGSALEGLCEILSTAGIKSDYENLQDEWATLRRVFKMNNNFNPTLNENNNSGAPNILLYIQYRVSSTVSAVARA